MDTRGKTNAEFRTEVQEVLTRHESSFDHVNTTLQQVLHELQELRVGRGPRQTHQEVNPFSSAATSNANGDSRAAHLNLSFPKFNGEDPTGWIYKAEQYFDFKGISSDQQVPLASFHLEGIALQWHRWLTKFRGPLTWHELTQAALLRFGPTDYDDPSESLTRLRQTTTVTAYQEAFERLSHRVDGLPEHFLIGCFVAGLRDDIRLDVKIKHPNTLAEAIGVARLIEERNQIQRKGGTPYRGQPAPVATRVNSNPNPGILGPPPGPPTTPPTAPARIRRISTQEARERREKGLCYYCDEKFAPGHRCERPQLFMIEDIAEPAADDGGDDKPPVTESHEIIPEISFHAIAGASHPQTIRVAGRLKNKDLTVLIDGGSTHNFIDQTIVSRYGLPITHNKKFQVMVANKEQIECGGVCRALTIDVQGTPITADFYILPVAACPIVLGVQWLATLGPIETDYSQLTMSFTQDGVTRTFHGLKQQGVEVLTDKDFHGLSGIGTYGTAFFIQMGIPTTGPPITGSPPDLEQLLSKFSWVFDNPTSLPPTRRHDHQILLEPNSSPVSVRPYRYPYYQKAEIEKIVQELLAKGFIRPSRSPFSSPVLLVKKTDGEWRFCVDYRALNLLTIKDKFPIPVIDELLDELHGARFFSKLDLRAGYHQIRMHAQDIPKTAFRTHEGHYEFVVMPFGLTNAPATFQSLMNDLFRSYLRKFILIFFDDILVYSTTWDDHLAHLNTVLSILSANQLFAKRSKCSFGVTTVNYLGHLISEQGVSVEPSKIAAILSWPTPTTTRGVRGFLGLAGYYRKFIRQFGSIAAPLTRLLSKEGFQWTTEAENSFNHLKAALTSPPVLRLPNFSQPFVIECDASGIGLGAVLTQDNHPIAYYSEALKPSARSLSTYEKEMLAIVKAIKKWRPYLLGKPFVVRTDQRSLKYLLEQRITTPAQTRWLPKIMGYDYVVEYKKGPENQAADSLSRVVEFHCMSTSMPQAEWWNQLQVEVLQDPFYHTLATKPHHTLRDGVWFSHGKLVLSPTSFLISKLLAEHHSSPTGGHFGYHKTLARLRRSFHWPHMRKTVKEFIRQCDPCQRFKTDSLKPAGLLQPLGIPERIWTEISMDFIEGLPSSNGYTVILVVVDRLSKYAHFAPLRHPYTALTVAKTFVDHVVRLHGVPTSIVSDRDKVFLSAFWRTLFQLQGTQLKMSSSYHPQTDGQTEVINRVLEQYLRCFTGNQPRRWVEWLPWAEYSYNTSVHSSTLITPFEAVYGIKPPDLLSYVPGTSRVAAVDTCLRDRDSLLRDLRLHLKQAQDRMRSHADQRRRDLSFEVGDWVYLKLQPYRQFSVAARLSAKLSPRFFGPYEITEKLGSVAYRLALPPGSKIHNVFHVSLLRRYHGSVPAASPPLPQLDDATSAVLPQPEVVLDRRIIQKHKYRPKTEILVKWKGAPLEDATWENEWRMSKTYPDFILADKDV